MQMSRLLYILVTSSQYILLNFATLTTAYNNFRQSTASYLRQQAVQPLESGARTAVATNYVKNDEAIADKLHEIADMGYDSAKKRDIAISEDLLLHYMKFRLH